jgi:citrate synthase
MSDKAEIKVHGKTYELPLVCGTEDEWAIDISSFRAQSGVITLDPGFKNTGSTTSAITFLDGEKGLLRHRGYPIDQLAEQSSFLEVAYLLVYEHLPSKTELTEFQSLVSQHTLIHEDFRKILDGFPSVSHPMGVLSAMITAMTAFYPKSLDPNRSWDEVNTSIIRIIAKITTLSAFVYKNKIGHPIVYPRNDLDYCSNFLHMMFATPSSDYQVNPVVANALDKLLIVHADHEQNCSASTVRIVGSSLASLYTSLSAGVNALWGPLHGGANQAVIEMLEAIKLDGGDTAKWMEKAKDKDDPFRLMGFGHRVYKNFDPRATNIKQRAHELFEKLGVNDPML